MGKDKPIVFKNIEKYVRLYLALLMILLVLKIILVTGIENEFKDRRSSRKII